MKKRYYSNGKLLLTGEYLVLDGAEALALPASFGQDLIVEKGGNNEIKWVSYDYDNSIWFEDTIPFEAVTSKTHSENQVRNTLIDILCQASLMNPGILKETNGYQITTHLTFPRNWGLGTSSTLINNIAQWFAIDAFALLKNSFGGSGYDIACAKNNSPVLYSLRDGSPMTTLVSFHPEFTDKLYFVYLNQKQNSRSAIAAYYSKRGDITKEITGINDITAAILNTTDANEFASLLQRHENILSGILETKTIKDELFPDFDGTIKSLGAWGGDFILAVAKENPEAYFRSKGYETIIAYNKMILNK